MSKEFIEKISSSLKPAEKSKILQELINKVNENDVNNVLSECKNLPSFQYNWLKLAFANKFQRFDLALELLQNEEKSILSKTAKKSWLYDSNNQLGNSDYLLNEFFPSVSLCCRRKVINNIALYIKNEQQVTKIFDVVEKKYGFNAAVPLIASCTKEKIQLILLERKFILKSRQIRRIIEKFPDVGLQYLKDRYPNLTKCEELQYQSTLNYLYKNYPNDFIQLFIAYHKKMPGFKIGRCRSKKMIQKFRSEILENPITFSKLLNVDQLQTSLKHEDFMLLFETIFPDNIDNINSISHRKWLNTFQKDKRLNIIKSVYMKLYKINLDDHPEYIDPDTLLLLPVDRRLSVIEWKIKNVPVNSSYFEEMVLHYFGTTINLPIAWSIFKPTEYSVPEFERALSIERNINSRFELIKCLLLTCRLNNDLVKLLHVLNLLNKSFPDNHDVKKKCFKIITSMMRTMNFSEEHWCIILEMLQASFAIDKLKYSNVGLNILEKCLSSQIKSKKLLEKIFSFLLKLKVEKYWRDWTWTDIKNQEDGNTLFQFYVKELESLYSTLKSNSRTEYNVDCLHKLAFDFIHHICKYNRKQRKKLANSKCIFLSDNDFIQSNIQQILKNEINDGYVERSKKLYEIIRELRCEQRESLNASCVWDDLFSIFLISLPIEVILMHYLYENPSKLDDIWPIILSNMINANLHYRFIRQIKSCNYSSLRSQSIKICTEMIDSPTATLHQKCNSIVVLSILSEPESFLSLASKYYPYPESANFSPKHFKSHYQVKQTFAKCLALVSSSDSILSVIEKFSLGDYLKLTVGSLWSHVIRSSESKALDFLRPRLYNSQVSFQKYIIRLFFEISTLNDQMDVLKNMVKNNIPINHEMFLRAKCVFIANPSCTSWNLFKDIMEKVSSFNVTTLTNICLKPKIHQISIEYVSDYVLLCLATLKKAKVKFMHEFLFKIETEQMDRIDEDVLDNIVLSYNTNDSFNECFLFNYLFNSSTVENYCHRISNVNLCLKNIIQKVSAKITPKPLSKKPLSEKPFSKRSLSKESDYVTQDSVFQFVDLLCKKAIFNKQRVDLKKQTLQDIISFFESEFLSVAFKEIFYMKLTLLLIPILYQESTGKLKLFGRSVGQLIDQFIQAYGTEITPIICKETKSFIFPYLLMKFADNPDGAVEIVDGILETSVSKTSRIVCCELLRDINPTKKNVKATYERVMEFLKNSDVGIVYHCLIYQHSTQNK